MRDTFLSNLTLTCILNTASAEEIGGCLDGEFAVPECISSYASCADALKGGVSVFSFPEAEYAYLPDGFKAAIEKANLAYAWASFGPGLSAGIEIYDPFRKNTANFT